MPYFTQCNFSFYVRFPCERTRGKEKTIGDISKKVKCVVVATIAAGMWGYGSLENAVWKLIKKNN